MPVKDLGSKWICFKCGTKFYDLKKPEPLCPKCGSNAQETPSVKATAAERKRAAKEAVEEPAVEAAEAAEEDLEAEEIPAVEEEAVEEEDVDA